MGQREKRLLDVIGFAVIISTSVTRSTSMTVQNFRGKFVT